MQNVNKKTMYKMHYPYNVFLYKYYNIEKTSFHSGVNMIKFKYINTVYKWNIKKTKG